METLDERLVKPCAVWMEKNKLLDVNPFRTLSTLDGFFFGWKPVHNPFHLDGKTRKGWMKTRLKPFPVFGVWMEIWMKSV